VPATEEKRREEKKTAAKEFLDELSTYSSNTNLHAAFLEGLLRAKRDADDSSDETVTILMLLSDGQATSGETNRKKIAEDVYKLNRDGKVKIFSLGFQGNADMELLDAIAIMNGSVTTPILEGYIDFASQIKSFFASEFGTVLLSDVSVTLKGDATAYGETQQTFPLLADGYEIVLQGLLEEHESTSEHSLQAVTTAATTDGITSWTATAVQDSSTTSQAKNSLCFQSYAHARVTQLLRLCNASEFFGIDILVELVSCLYLIPEQRIWPIASKRRQCRWLWRPTWLRRV
jgi:hypothetical protein